MKTSVHFKGIEEERLQDAPFIGALILSVDCHNNCPGCFNQHLKEKLTICASIDDILDEIQKNPLHQGIILGGLEWTEQLWEMYDLIFAALERKLQVMLYTHWDERSFQLVCTNLIGTGIYVKFGAYEKGLPGHTSEGIILASSNQIIKKI